MCYPNVTYTHSRSHVFNLAISSSCGQHCFNQESFGQCHRADLVPHSASAKRKAIFLNCIIEDLEEIVIELLVQSAWTKLVGVVTRRWRPCWKGPGSKKQTMPKLYAVLLSQGGDIVFSTDQIQDSMELLKLIKKSSTSDAEIDERAYDWWKIHSLLYHWQLLSPFWTSRPCVGAKLLMHTMKWCGKMNIYVYRRWIWWMGQ